MFERLKIGYHKTCYFKPRLMLQVEQATYVQCRFIDAVLDFKIDYKVKILKDISVEWLKCLNEDVTTYKKK